MQWRKANLPFTGRPNGLLHHRYGMVFRRALYSGRMLLMVNVLVPSLSKGSHADVGVSKLQVRKNSDDFVCILHRVILYTDSRERKTPACVCVGFRECRKAHCFLGLTRGL